MMRILQVVSVMDVGGMESFIMNVYRHVDRSQMQFDFLVHHARRGAFEDEIESLGGHVYHTSLMDDGNFLKYRKALKTLYHEHPEYRIVHGHLGSTALWYLGEAERQGVPWRILHSHCPGRIYTLKGGIKHILFRFSPKHANVRLACSNEAGRYQFRQSAFTVIPNGIDVKRFSFDPNIRSELRKSLGIDNCFVIGNVGRFYYEKNHAYMLKVFQAFQQTEQKSALMLLGSGELMEKTQELAKELGVEKSVMFLGLQKDPAPYYQAMDAFILPSFYEGMPLVGIEAQSSGVPCLFSKGVSPEAKLSDRVEFLEIGEANVSQWTEALKRIHQGYTVRGTPPQSVWEYDAEAVARKMAKRYQEMLGTVS